MKAHRLDHLLAVLLSASYFLKRYPQQETYGQRRALIAEYCWSSAEPTIIEDREQLRRAIDHHLGIPPNPRDGTFSKYAHLPDHFDLQPKPEPTRSSSMERNLPALLRSDAKTVLVKFPGSKGYTYVTHLTLVVGDYVVVNAEKEIKIGQVIQVDDEVKIEPGSDIEYKWVIDVVNMAAHEINTKRNDDIQAEAATIIRGNLRRSFAQQVLGAAGDEQRQKLLVLTGNVA